MIAYNRADFWREQTERITALYVTSQLESQPLERELLDIFSLSYLISPTSPTSRASYFVRQHPPSDTDVEAFRNAITQIAASLLERALSYEDISETDKRIINWTSGNEHQREIFARISVERFYQRALRTTASYRAIDPGGVLKEHGITSYEEFSRKDPKAFHEFVASLPPLTPEEKKRNEKIARRKTAEFFSKRFQNRLYFLHVYQGILDRVLNV